MKKRSLGTQGLEVTSLGYGAMGSTSFYGPADVQEGIPGTRNRQRLEENVGAAELSLSRADLARIPNGGFGARYAEAMLPKWV
jgi:aryl-alcohol dehydrogenase-like predicted oxidoreductase